MPQQVTTSVENNFTKGLITESTGLNFPENAATDADNCEFTLIGDTLRRLGIDKELNGVYNSIDRTGKAINTYKWNNAGGDGVTQLCVQQVGSVIYFYDVTSSTVASPLSTHQLASTVDLINFIPIGGSFDSTKECQFSDGDGHLFIFHPSCDPVFCSYVSGVITPNSIAVTIRDFTGITEPGIADTVRPGTLSIEHQYNLVNQGWVKGNPWIAQSNTPWVPAVGVKIFNVTAGLAVTVGDIVKFSNIDDVFPGGVEWVAGSWIATGSVTGYSGTNLTINITAASSFGSSYNNWQIVPVSSGYINTWFGAVSSYPSNSDVWWYYKNSSGIFDPATTIGNIPIGGPAPKGHFLVSAFDQQRSIASGIIGLTPVSTQVRPRTGAWFQGRVWYTGVDAQQAATGDSTFYTWTENIYFSQIVTDTDSFGNCYQTNDPTSSTVFDLLPTDGGVIHIQGCGSIYKLFPLMNALLIFAANGVWYLTGSQGIGFAANDYTIVKLSSVQSISSSSFVDVQGLPYFWNEEGIYAVKPAKQGQGLFNSPLHVNPLEVSSITVGTILSLYNEIPLSSKKYVKAAYHPIDYVIQWVYRDTEATDVTGRYTYNKILNFNTVNNAFFPYTVDASVNSINGIIYVSGPGGSTTLPPAFKYLTSQGLSMSFAEEYDEDYVDWGSVNYVSTFTTGYKLRGQAIKKFQPQYIQVYSRTNGAASAYKIQGLWNYSNDRSSGKWTSVQRVINGLTRFDTVFRRHKIRGVGFAIQFKFLSEDGYPFDIQGWAVEDTVNQGT